MPYKSAEEQRLYMANYRQKNLERLRENDRNRYHVDLEESKRRQRQRYKENPEKYKKSTAVYRSANKDECCRRDRIYKLTIKIEVLLHYSNGNLQCNLCEDNRFACLTIDHINGDGNKHRRLLGLTGGVPFLRWLRTSNFPTGYMVLCSNCNWKKYKLQIVGESRASKWRQQQKILVMQKLGGCCLSCGLSDIDILTIHHINNDGADHRRLIKHSGVNRYKAILDEDCFDDLECRCFSCNDFKEWNFVQNEFDEAMCLSEHCKHAKLLLQNKTGAKLQRK